MRRKVKHGIQPEGLYLFTSGIPDQPTDLLAAYLEEKRCSVSVTLHTVLFNVDDYDSEGPIPGRYANINKTSDSLRYLAHCSGGRFHWFRETGIIESDDIRLIMREIDRAVNFSRKAKLLVDSVKRKCADKYRALGGDSVFEDVVSLESSCPRLMISNTVGGVKALPPPVTPAPPPEIPRATALSLTRQNRAKELRLEATKSERNFPDPMDSVR